MMPRWAYVLLLALSQALAAVRATKGNAHVKLNAAASMKKRPYLLLRVGEIDGSASPKRSVGQ